MKRVVIAIALAAGMFGLAGCETLKAVTKPLHKAPSAEQQAAETPQAKAKRLAHATLDEGYALVYALHKTITSNVKNKVWTADQATEVRDEVEKLRARLDNDVKPLLAVANYADAESQAVAIKELLLAVQRRVAAAAQSAIPPPEPILT